MADYSNQKSKTSAVTPLISQQQLEQLLEAVLKEGETKQATDILNKALRNVNTSLLLLNVIQTNQSPPLRQLAAVVLRQKIVNHWKKLKPEARQHIKSALLERLIGESVNYVRHQIIEVVSTLAVAIVPDGEWRELFEFLGTLSASKDAAHREISMNLIEALSETIMTSLRGNLNDIFKLAFMGLADQSDNVQVAALKAVGSIVLWLETENEVALFKEVMPAMFKVIISCITKQMDSEAIHAFEIFDEFLELNIPGGSACVPDILTFGLRISTDKSVDTTIRRKAMTVIEWATSYKSKAVIKAKLLTPVIEAIFSIAIEPKTEEELEEELDQDEDENSSVARQDYAMQLLDRLCVSLPRHTFPLAIQAVKTLAASTEKAKKEVAVWAIGNMSDGCKEQICKPDLLPMLLQFLVQCFNENDRDLKVAVCITLGQFSKYLQPMILDYHAQVLPVLFASLSETDDRALEGSLLAVESFAESLQQEQILPFLQPLVTKLLEIFQRSTQIQQSQQEYNEHQLLQQEFALAALSAAVLAAKDSFIPFADPVIGLLKPFMTLRDEQTISLRARATECLGIIAGAIGKQHFQPHLQEVVKLALEGIALDSPEIREYTYNFFCNIAEVLKEDFRELLPVVLPLILSSCESNDTVFTESESDKVEGIERGSDDEEEGEDDEAAWNMQVRTAFIDEKTSAVNSIGIICEAVGSNFMPFLPRILNTLTKHLVKHFHEEVRQMAMTSLEKITSTLYTVSKAGPDPTSWVPNDKLHQQFIEVLGIVVPILVDTIDNDMFKTVSTTAIEAAIEIIKKIGEPVTHASGLMFLKSFLSVLSKRTKSQEGEELAAGEEEEEDEIAFCEAAMDGIVDLARFMRQALVPHFSTVCQSLYPYLRHKTIPRYHTAAIGTLADICQSLGVEIEPYVDEIFQFAQAGVADEEPSTRSNSTFLVGVLCKYGYKANHSIIQKSLAALVPLFTDDSIPNLRDNLCGAICRMIDIADPKDLPLAQLLDFLMSNIPLKIDMAENKTVYPCLFALVKSSNPVMAPFLPRLTSVFARSLISKTVETEYKQEMIVILKALFTQYGDHMKQIFVQLQPAERSAIEESLK